MNGKPGYMAAHGGLPKSGAGTRPALALIALAALCCSSAWAQERTADDWVKMGEELLLNDSLEESVEAFDKAIEVDPQNAEAWRYKALILRDQGEYDEAIAAFDKAIEIDPQDTKTRVHKASLLIIMGRQAEALAIFDESTAEVPKDPEERFWQSSAWRSKGNVFAEKGLWNEALTAYDRAIELGSGDPLATYAASSNKGRVLNKLGRYEEAVEACDRALGAYNESPAMIGGEPWLWKGEALEGIWRLDEAARAYEQAAAAFELDTSAYPEIAKFWLFLARALEGMGRHEGAVASYERAVEAFEVEIETHAESSNIWRYQWMGESLEVLGRDSEAVAAYARARELGYEG